MAKKCIVIGAGIGGLATANLLAKAGYEVHVYEKEAQAGGRAGKLEVDGFTFDTGPSWYLMPEVFEHFYELMDESIDTWLDLERLTPAYKVFYEQFDPIVINGDVDKDSVVFEAVEPGAGVALKKYVEQSNQIYRLSLDHFLYTNFQHIGDLINKAILKKLFLLPQLLLRPIDSYVSSYVSDVRLKQILEYPTVFLGTSPFSAPAMYSLMSALDFKDGVYYPKGGMYTIIESLVAIAQKNGVVFHFGASVDSIETNDGVITGILLDGVMQAADIVVSNADLQYTETHLLDTRDQTYGPSYWDKKEPGPSALLMYLGVDREIPEFEHHNLVFVDDWQKNFSDIYQQRVMPHPASIYICKTSKTDKTVAPAGKENIFVLVPLPAGVEIDDEQLSALADNYMEQIESMTGVSFTDQILVKRLFGPNDFKEKFHSWHSSMLGQSHLLNQSAFFRTPNISKKVKNLYYVGGSTTPGIGLPMCLIGAELVYKRIVGDRKGGKVQTITIHEDPV